MSTTLTIGKVAAAAGVGVETVRFYERQGLLDKPLRSPAGYRQYDAAAIRRLKFIVQAKKLGFTLPEVGELLALRSTPDSGCADVQAKALAKIADVDRRIAQLTAVRNALTTLVGLCDGAGPMSACPIVDALDRELL